MAKCIQCDKEAQPGSNLCKDHNLDGRDVLYLQRDEDVNSKDSI